MSILFDWKNEKLFLYIFTNSPSYITFGKEDWP